MFLFVQICYHVQLYYKPLECLPHYYLLGEIYGKDHDVGANSSNADDEEEGLSREDATMNHNEGEDDDFVENVNMNVDLGSPFEGLMILMLLLHNQIPNNKDLHMVHQVLLIIVVIRGQKLWTR